MKEKKLFKPFLPLPPPYFFLNFNFEEEIARDISKMFNVGPDCFCGSAT